MAKQVIKGRKYWNFTQLDDENCELTLEGEMLDTRPTDWWTGEAVPGSYVCSDEFEKEWQNFRNTKNLTIKVNSPGGDLATGLGMRNKLMEYEGNLTIINIGFMASAASLLATIPQATVKAYKGSIFMIHGVMGYFAGYFNASELKANLKSLEALDKAIANMYAEKMNIDEDKIRNRMANETYYVGQEAVDEGLADELIDSEEADVVIEVEEDDDETINQARISFNGYQRKGFNLLNLINKVDPNKVNIKSNSKTKINEKEEKIVDEQQLLEQYGDLIENIVNQRTIQAIAQERSRLKDIDDIANSIEDKELIYNAKYGEEPKTAQELAFDSLKNQKTVINNNFLAARANQATQANLVQGGVIDPTQMNKEPTNQKEKLEKELAEAKASFDILKTKNGGAI